MRILHVSDTHLTAAGVESPGGRALESLLRDLAPLSQLDLIVVAGDCSDDGSPDSYAALRAMLDGFAAPRGARVLYTVGNHDDRAGFAAVLGDGAGQKHTGSTSIFASVRLGDIRVTLVDSSIPGAAYGRLDEDQLALLRRDMMSQPAPSGTVLVVHHPPCAPVTPLHQGIGLQNPGALAEALEHSDVRLILSGHYHHYLGDYLDSGGQSIPVLVSPGVVNLNDTLAAPGHERSVSGSGCCLIELRPAGPRVQVLQRGSGAVLSDWSPNEVAAIAARIDAPPAPGATSARH